ncbi:MAG: hypothetical protein ABI860_02440 [Gemmatimonadales bacterium]
MMDTVIAALAQTADTAATAAATAEAPVLDYTFTWPTFLLCLGLVLGYYVFVLKLSEKEFRGIINERFGPPGGGRGGLRP